MAGGIPSILSTAGFCILPRNCLAKEERLSANLLCPSAKRVSNASEDFPLPLNPLTTTSLPRGILRSIPLRLFALAPFMYIYSLFSAIPLFSKKLLPAGPQHCFHLPDFLQGGGDSVQVGVVAYRNAYLSNKFCLVARLAPLIYGKGPH